jgi:hypothetical protein
VVKLQGQPFVLEDHREAVMDMRIRSRCRYVRITIVIHTGFTHVTVTSCTTALRHTSGQDTITVTDIEYAFFLHMFTDMYTME